MSITFSMTAGDLVARAMQARRALALGRTPTADELAYGLERLNLILKPLARDQGTQWAWEEATATVEAGDPDVLLDPRPADVVSVSLVLAADNRRMLARWEPGQHDALPNPNSVGDPTIYIVRETADGTIIRVWPVPSADRTISYRYIRVPEDVAAASALDVPQDWLGDLELVLADDLAAFAQNNPELPGKAAMARAMLRDRARPDSYFVEPFSA